MVKKRKIVSKKKVNNKNKVKKKVVSKSKSKIKKKTVKKLIKAKKKTQKKTKTKTTKRISSKKKKQILRKPSKSKKLKKKVKKTKPKKKLIKKLKEVFSHFIPRKPRKYKLISGVPWYERETGSTLHFGEEIKGSVETFMNSSHGNNKDPALSLPEAFERAFINKLAKGPFEADEILIYRFGIMIRPRGGGFLTESVKEKISVIVNSIPNSSIHVVKEDNTFSLRINLGSTRKGELSGNVSEELDKYKDKLSEVYSSVVDEFGSSDWYSFWDTEDAMYE
jgi:hypothetical protein